MANDEVSADTALWIDQTLKEHFVVQFWDNANAVNQAINAIDDYLFDIAKGKHEIELTTGQMDVIIEKTIQVARHRIC